MSSDVDDIFDLRDELDRESQRYATAAASIGTVSASNASGSIEVTLEPAERKLAVTIRESWRSTYEASELGSAIVDTVTILATERMQKWTESVAESSETPAANTRPLPPTSESVSEQVRTAIDAAGDSVDMTTVMSDMMSILEEVNAGVESAMAIVTARAQAAHAGKDASGKVTATVDGSGSLRSVDFEENWLDNRQAAEISREANAAIAAALRAATAAAPENDLVGTPLEKYGAVLTDPQAIARILLRKD